MSPDERFINWEGHPWVVVMLGYFVALILMWGSDHALLGAVLAGPVISLFAMIPYYLFVLVATAIIALAPVPISLRKSP